MVPISSRKYSSIADDYPQSSDCLNQKTQNSTRNSWLNYLRKEPLKLVHSFNPAAARSFKIGQKNREAVIVKKAPVFLSDYEKSQAILTDATLTGDDIAEFIRANYRPLVGQRTKTNQVYFYSTRPLCVVYYDANFDHQYEKARDLIWQKVAEVAKYFPDITYIFFS